MTHYICILLGLSFFWTSIVLTFFFERAIFSPLFCLLLYSIPYASKNVLYFLTTLYFLEQFMLHGSFGFPLLVIIPTLSITVYLQRVTRISLFVTQIFGLLCYVFIEKYFLALMYYNYVPAYDSPFYNFCALACTMAVLSFLMPVYAQKG